MKRLLRRGLACRMLSVYSSSRFAVESMPVFQNIKKANSRMASPSQMSASGEKNPKPDRPATKIKVIAENEATGATAAAYEFCRAASGRPEVPGIFKCFGSRPDFLRQVAEFSNTIHFSEGHLTRRHKEMIATYVSYLNRCPY